MCVNEDEVRWIITQVNKFYASKRLKILTKWRNLYIFLPSQPYEMGLNNFNVKYTCTWIAHMICHIYCLYSFRQYIEQEECNELFYFIFQQKKKEKEKEEAEEECHNIEKLIAFSSINFNWKTYYFFWLLFLLLIWIKIWITWIMIMLEILYQVVTILVPPFIW